LAGKLEGKQVCIQEPVGKLVLVGKQVLVCMQVQAGKLEPVGKQVCLPEGKQVCKALVYKVVRKLELYHSNGLDSLTKGAPKHSKEELRQKPQVYFSFIRLLFFI
jgi:hypothetical protein